MIDDTEYSLVDYVEIEASGLTPQNMFNSLFNENNHWKNIRFYDLPCQDLNIVGWGSRSESIELSRLCSYFVQADDTTDALVNVNEEQNVFIINESDSNDNKQTLVCCFSTKIKTSNQTSISILFFKFGASKPYVGLLRPSNQQDDVTLITLKMDNVMQVLKDDIIPHIITQQEVNQNSLQCPVYSNLENPFVSKCSSAILTAVGKTTPRPYPFSDSIPAKSVQYDDFIFTRPRIGIRFLNKDIVTAAGVDSSQGWEAQLSQQLPVEHMRRIISAMESSKSYSDPVDISTSASASKRPCDCESYIIGAHVVPVRQAVTREGSITSLTSSQPKASEFKLFNPFGSDNDQTPKDTKIVSPIIEVSTRTQSVNSESDNTTISKVLVECPAVFGEGIKKVWKVVLPSLERLRAAGEVNAGSVAYQSICRDVAAMYSLPFPTMNDDVFTIFYVDADLGGEVVHLDAYSIEEFLVQSKKVLVIRYSHQAGKAAISTAITSDIKNDVGSADSMTTARDVCVEVIQESQLNPKIVESVVVEEKYPLIIVAKSDDSNKWEMKEWEVAAKQIVDANGILYAVNGVRLARLDKSMVLTLLKQRQRPLLLTFTNINTFGVATMKDSNRGGETHSKISEELFMKKFNEHPIAKNLRAQVKKSIQDFVDCEWKRIVGNGREPETFVSSLYRSIENELRTLGLFDARQVQGGGSPVNMGDEHWKDIGIHIETLVFRHIYDRVMELAPDSGVYTLVEQTVKGNVDNSIIQNRPSSASVQRGMLPLRLKLAYLRFLSLKHMGINLPANEIGVVNMHLFPSDKMRADPPEEWRIALKEMCRALEMKSPVSIMQRLRVAIQLITRSLETLMDKRRFQPSGYTPSTSSSNVIFWRSRFDSMWPDISLGADELMPAISWALIQTNHPSLDAAVWMCSEFRHHSLHMGEGAYALTQLSSALEFCKEALASSFDIEESLFLKYIRQYDVTQDLIRLCKNGDAAGVASCLADGADINGLTFSQDESPLTAAISENNVDIVELLLSSPLIDVNARIFPFHCHLPATDDEKRSALHDATPLMVAALNGIINIVELLLRKGANRYLTNENGDSATALAFSRGHMKVVRMLLADQANTSLSAALRMRSMFLVEGLLSQSNVNINESSEENSVLGNPPLFDAICTGKLEFVNVIVSHKLIDIHKTNQNRDTALIWCCKSNGEELTDDIRAKIACLLLKMGIVRQAVDINGKTALDLARVSSDNYTDSSWSRYKGSKYPHLATILHYSPVDNHIYSLAKMQDYDGVCALIEQSVDVNSSCPVNSYTALIAAIFNRDIKIIEILLKQPNIDVNKCGKNKMTALHHACEMGYVEGISLLLQAGADRVSRNSLGETPLDCAVRNNNELAADCMRFDPQKISICLAAKHGDWRVMNALLSQGVSINARKKHFVDGAGNTAISHELATPLIAAVAYNQKELVTSLITNTELNVDINATNEIGQSALVYAASLENESMVLFLLKHGANRYLKDNEGHTAYNWASKKGYRAISDILRCDPNVSSVHDAIIAGEIESTIAFFKQDPNPNARWSPRNPMDSTRSQNSEVTSSTTSKLSEGDTPLVVAAKFDKIPLIQLLLRAPDLDINFTDGKGRTALMHASFQGFEPVVLLLLRHKASRQIVDYSNKKAIDYAIKGGFTDIAFILKADPYIVHIHDACERGDVGIVHALLKQGCPPNFGDERSGKQRKTPLMAAAGSNKLEVVKLLLNTPGIDINARDSEKMTALMYAARCGALDVTAELLSSGCDRDAIDNKGKNAGDYAGSHGFVTMMQFSTQKMIR